MNCEKKKHCRNTSLYVITNCNDTHMNDIGACFSKHVIPVIPDAIKSKHFTVHLQKLFGFIKSRWSLVGSEGCSILPPLDVRICRHFL